MLAFLSINFMDNIAVLVIIILLFFCLSLFIKNKKLNDIIDNLRDGSKDNYERSIDRDDIINIRDISNKIDDKVIVSIKNEDSLDDNKINVNVINNKAYAKDILLDEDNITSSISLDTSCVSFNAVEFIKKDIVSERRLGSSKMDRDYLGEVSRKMAESLEPQTIELTDYEQEQEDNAIISYKELLDVNKRDREIIDDGTVEFIEELKKFRNNLGR